MNIAQQIEALEVPRLMPEGVDLPRWENRRREIGGMIAAHMYGEVRAGFDRVDYEETVINPYAFAGKAVTKKITITFRASGESYAFDFVLMLPSHSERSPVAVNPTFRKVFPDSYLPAEELIDRGVGVATFYYDDVIPDDRERAFAGGLGAYLSEGRRHEDSAGALSIWAWACSRVADYLCTADGIDTDNLMVIGHSRLGKTALLAGARDPRFRFVFANNAGCCGDSLIRAADSRAEHFEVITRVFPHWFCPRFLTYANDERALPFDQHFLISLIAPRFVCCGLAEADAWAGLQSQYWSYILAGPAWEVYGRPGLVHPDRAIRAGDWFREGSVGIFMREHRHYLSRYDWNRYLDFFSQWR
ncbi:MAG: hypothetical protein WDA00_06475 [Eubacteriales bacterium]